MTDDYVYCTGCKTEFAFISQGYIRRDLCIYCEHSLEPYDLNDPTDWDDDGDS